MITAILQGGLGNQMIQIAAAVSLACDSGVDFAFSTKYHDLPMQGRKCNVYLDSVFRNLNFIDDLSIKSIYREPSFYYNEIPKLKDVCLYGYFQSEKYFAHNLDKIKELFSIDSKSKEKIEQKYSKILNENPTSLHLRRGDYLVSGGSHPYKTRKYYNKAFDSLPKDTKYLVFSDDILWCKKTFPEDNFYFAENNEDQIDLYLMSMCRCNIIANSTFSWWAAWLNNNENKRIIAPKEWFGSTSNLSDRDIIPERWERM